MCREAKKSKIVSCPNDSEIKASKRERYCRVVDRRNSNRNTEERRMKE